MKRAVKVAISLPDDLLHRYVQGYASQPETTGEVEAARAASAKGLAAEPWE